MSVTVIKIHKIIDTCQLLTNENDTIATLMSLFFKI